MLCSPKNIYYYGKLTPSGIFVTWQGVISIQKWKIQRPKSPHSVVIYMACVLALSAGPTSSIMYRNVQLQGYSQCRGPVRVFVRGTKTSHRVFFKKTHAR